jgi:hypothetical protein
LVARLSVAHRRPGDHQPQRRVAGRRRQPGVVPTRCAARSTSTTWAGRSISMPARPTSSAAGASAPTPSARRPHCARRPRRWAPRRPKPLRHRTCCAVPIG